jgi:hypothetical protein
MSNSRLLAGPQKVGAGGTVKTADCPLLHAKKMGKAQSILVIGVSPAPTFESYAKSI